MKYFLEMIEAARRNGVIYSDDGGSHHLDKAARDLDFWRTVEQCEIFVFEPTSEEISGLPSASEVHTKHSSSANPDGSIDCPECEHTLWPNIDAPFKVFSYEILNGNITSPRTDAKVPVFIKCVMVRELEPKTYCYYALSEYSHPLLGTRKTVIATNTLGLLTQAIFRRLELEHSGIENTREKVKIGTGDSKRFHTIRRIIHICPKRAIPKYLKSTVRKIDFTHRFSIRGHWRTLISKSSGKIGRVGKDREGNYCVADWTWVNGSVKGPKDKPLIHKTRFVRVEKRGPDAVDLTALGAN